MHIHLMCPKYFIMWLELKLDIGVYLDGKVEAVETH